MENVPGSEFIGAHEAGQRYAAATQQAHDLEGKAAPYVVIEEGQQVESLESLLLRPLRITAAPKFVDVASFLAYVSRFQGVDTLLFASQEQHSVTALLDYHTAGGPSHVSHRATLTLKLSDEWKAWLGRNDQPQTQAQLAEFLDDRARDIREPDGATVLEVAKKLEVTKSVSFTQARNLDNGATQFSYVEDVATANRGSMTVPTSFVLGLKPYEHSEPYEVRAKFRYALREDKLTFRVKLDDPERILKSAFTDVLKAIGDGCQITPLLGQQ